MSFQRHPLSAAFPDMLSDEFDELVADIKVHGLRDSGVVYEGMVLDGWHRMRACAEAGVPFRYDHYKGKNPIALVISKNIHRRSLDASQRAMAVVTVHAWKPVGANQHAVAEARRVGHVTDPRQGESPSPEMRPVSTAQMAKEAGVGERTIRRAKKAHAAGKSADVLAGRVTVNAAARTSGARPRKARVADSRDARIAELEAEVLALKDDLANLRDVSAEAFAAYEANQEALDNPEGKAILLLQGKLAHVTSERDKYQAECNSMRKQIALLERKLARYEPRAA